MHEISVLSIIEMFPNAYIILKANLCDDCIISKFIYTLW